MYLCSSLLGALAYGASRSPVRFAVVCSLCRSARPKLHASPGTICSAGSQTRRLGASSLVRSRALLRASRWASLEDMQDSKCWEWACCSSLAGLVFRSTVSSSIADECEESFGHLVGAVRHEFAAMGWDPDSPKIPYWYLAEPSPCWQPCHSAKHPD
jgi:hypothetical protein